ncbi:MAG TPA: type II toxin-antitoxin system HicB family antitoxin [Candidatus Lokiarchaeia archaeon]|nr:type II toxin-antitoxin system HicB family antitoxin [Candidatus Lokiarchaeia archaeon]
MRQVITYHGENDCWIAECLSLPVYISQGKTREDAISNIKDAIEGYIKSLDNDGIPIPEKYFDTLLIVV